MSIPSHLEDISSQLTPRKVIIPVVKAAKLAPMCNNWEYRKRENKMSDSILRTT